jgi:hypothetical protein
LVRGLFLFLSRFELGDAIFVALRVWPHLFLRGLMDGRWPASWPEPVTEFSQMRQWHRMALSLLAANLLIGSLLSESPYAAETAEISSTPAAQIDPNSLRPPAAVPTAPSPYPMDLNTNEGEPPGLKEYMDASEEISLFGIDLRIERRKAEKEIQGLLVVDIAPGSPGASAGLHPYRQPTRDILNGVGMLATMAFPPAAIVVPTSNLFRWARPTI